MKKISLFLAILLIFASMTLVVGCKKKTTTEVKKELPTFEKLVEVNEYSEIFKTYKNLHIHNVSTNSDTSESIIEDIVLMPGNDKIEYHMRATDAETNEVIQEASRIGNAWYYYDVDEGTNAILEVGVSLVAEFSLPDYFDESKPVGNPYLDGGYIVQHAYSIFNRYDDIDAVRYDYTYYFNQETYLLEKVNVVRYNENHEVVEDNLSVFKYNVNLADVFESTIYDKMYSAENRIDVEIVVDYNTENEKRYNLVATTDSILYAATINDVTYLTYSDPECQNEVADLSMYEGLKSVTLYATELTFDEEVRYTVTEEEWNFWTTHKNYTIEQYYNNEIIIHKYTEEALLLDNGNIILFMGDKQYSLSKHENGFVASDCTGLEFENNGLLSGGYIYDEFTYDEELEAYVLDLLAEYGMYWEVKFENGTPVSIIYNEFSGDELVCVIISYYHSVGTTVVDIPDYVFEEEVEDTSRYTITEEEWNLNINLGNYAGTLLMGMELYDYKCTGNVIKFGENLIVFEDGKIYLLSEVDGVWNAMETDEFVLLPTMLPLGIDLSDYEYDEEGKLYVPKDRAEDGFYYSIGFKDGVLSYIMIQTTLDKNSPEYYDELIAITISEIGTVVIDVPEYVA